MVEAHVMVRHITEVVIDPSHINRTESEEFRHTKERLKSDGHYKCWICGTTENLQVHHNAVEWMFENDADFTLVKEFVEEWDVYGYGRLLKNQPVLTVDDIRCTIVLCQEHHTGVDHEDKDSGTGMHEMTFSAWLMQKLAKKGRNPVPQRGEMAEQVLKEQAEEA